MSAGGWDSKYEAAWLLNMPEGDLTDSRDCTDVGREVSFLRQLFHAVRGFNGMAR